MAKPLTDEEFAALAARGAELKARQQTLPQQEKAPDVIAHDRMVELIQRYNGSTLLIGRALKMKQKYVKLKIDNLDLESFRCECQKPVADTLRQLLVDCDGPNGVARLLNYSINGFRTLLFNVGITPEEISKWDRRKVPLDPDRARAAMEKWGGNVRRAADELGCSYSHLYVNLDKLGLRGMTDHKARRPIYREGRPVPPHEEPEVILCTLEEKDWIWSAAASALGVSEEKLRRRIKFLHLQQVVEDRFERWKLRNDKKRFRMYADGVKNQPLSSFIKKEESDL